MKLLTLFSALALSVFAQNPTFEVASVRPGGPGGVRGGCHGIDSRFDADDTVPPLGRCVITAGRLSHLIGIAYELNSLALIKGGPAWAVMGDDRYTIQAEAENPRKTTEKELLAMLQGLLEDRFQLKYHREEKLLPGFAMIVDKGGPKLTPSVSDSTAMGFGPSAKPRPGEPTNLTARKVSMARLAELLGQVGLGPVVNETGLDGFYDFKLSWDIDDALTANPGKSDGNVSGESLSTAIRRQLGLRLEPRKVPVSYFVIDSAQKPKEN